MRIIDNQRKAGEDLGCWRPGADLAIYYLLFEIIYYSYLLLLFI